MPSRKGDQGRSRIRNVEGAQLLTVVLSRPLPSTPPVHSLTALSRGRWPPGLMPLQGLEGPLERRPGGTQRYFKYSDSSRVLVHTAEGPVIGGLGKTGLSFPVTPPVNPGLAHMSPLDRPVGTPLFGHETCKPLPPHVDPCFWIGFTTQNIQKSVILVQGVPICPPLSFRVGSTPQEAMAWES